MVLGQTLVALGLVLVAHAGYSSVHYNTLVEARYGAVDVPTPWDVYLELIISFLVVVYGSLLTIGPFQPIFASSAPTLKYVQLSATLCSEDE